MLEEPAPPVADTVAIGLPECAARCADNLGPLSWAPPTPSAALGQGLLLSQRTAAASKIGVMNNPDEIMRVIELVLLLLITIGVWRWPR